MKRSTDFVDRDEQAGSPGLTDGELAFLTVRIIEGHRLDHPDHPARDAVRRLGIIPEHGDKLRDFEYLWQEQGRIDLFDPVAGGLIEVPPAPCPWPDLETFLRRWREILPDARSDS